MTYKVGAVVRIIKDKDPLKGKVGTVTDVLEWVFPYCVEVKRAGHTYSGMYAAEELEPVAS